MVKVKDPCNDNEMNIEMIMKLTTTMRKKMTMITVMMKVIVTKVEDNLE